jgi:hypothetical protein
MTDPVGDQQSPSFFDAFRPESRNAKITGLVSELLSHLYPRVVTKTTRKAKLSLFIVDVVTFPYVNPVMP